MTCPSHGHSLKSSYSKAPNQLFCERRLISRHRVLPRHDAGRRDHAAPARCAPCNQLPYCFSGLAYTVRALQYAREDGLRILQERAVLQQAMPEGTLDSAQIHLQARGSDQCGPPRPLSRATVYPRPSSCYRRVWLYDYGRRLWRPRRLL